MKVFFSLQDFEGLRACNRVSHKGKLRFIFYSTIVSKMFLIKVMQGNSIKKNKIIIITVHSLFVFFLF